MRYFIDTEFSEMGPTQPLRLISLGIVADDGRQLYLEASYHEPLPVHDWVRENVLPHLGPQHVPAGVTYEVNYPHQLAQRLQAFCDPVEHGEPEFWGYYSDYDWVVLCQLFGSMVDLPDNWPMYCRDFRQWLDEHGHEDVTQPDDDIHHALLDARWIYLNYHTYADEKPSPKPESKPKRPLKAR